MKTLVIKEKTKTKMIEIAGRLSFNGWKVEFDYDYNHDRKCSDFYFLHAKRKVYIPNIDENNDEKYNDDAGYYPLGLTDISDGVRMTNISSNIDGDYLETVLTIDFSDLINRELNENQSN